MLHRNAICLIRGRQTIKTPTFLYSPRTSPSLSESCRLWTRTNSDLRNLFIFSSNISLNYCLRNYKKISINTTLLSLLFSVTSSYLDLNRRNVYLFSYSAYNDEFKTKPYLDISWHPVVVFARVRPFQCDLQFNSKTLANSQFITTIKMIN